MKRLKIGAIILSAALIMGCSSNSNSQAEYDSLMEEKQSLEAELEKQKKTTIQEATSSEITTEEVTTTVQETTTVVETTAQSETLKQGEDVEILSEYILNGSWYTYHFVIIQNNTDKTLNVSTNSKAYATDGTLVSVDSSEFDALGAGCVSAIWEMFNTDEEVAYCDTKITSKTPKYYESVIQDLSYEETLIKDGVIYEVTNNSSEAAKFVEGYALFFNGNEIVDWERNYFTDDDSEIKPGDTINQQFNCRKAFDRVEFYLNGEK